MLRPPDPLNEFLRACARVELDDDGRTHLADTARRVRDWSGVVRWAEYHGLTPLVWHHTQTSGVVVSASEWKQIGALVLRRRDQSRAQTDALLEITDALSNSGIDHLVLKGAVLAHALYPRPDLRAMGDVDILVAPSDGARAQTILGHLGFDAPLVPTSSQRFHHHLPIATRQTNGVSVSVEIHRDALSGDQPGTLRLGSLSQSPRDVLVAGRRLQAFGHVDMLVHLCAHALEPSDPTRLIAVADLVGYAARYVAEIDWEFMRRRHLRVVNALALMHYVTPLPQSLWALRPPRLASPPPGAGSGFTPLSKVATRGARRAFGDLLYPPEWWMHAYYSVPPHRSLFAVRWGRHLWRIAYWGARRVLARR